MNIFFEILMSSSSRDFRKAEDRGNWVRRVLLQRKAKKWSGKWQGWCSQQKALISIVCFKVGNTIAYLYVENNVP